MLGTTCGMVIIKVRVQYGCKSLGVGVGRLSLTRPGDSGVASHVEAKRHSYLPYYNCTRSVRRARVPERRYHRIRSAGCKLQYIRKFARTIHTAIRHIPTTDSIECLGLERAAINLETTLSSLVSMALLFVLGLERCVTLGGGPSGPCLLEALCSHLDGFFLGD